MATHLESFERATRRGERTWSTTCRRHSRNWRRCSRTRRPTRSSRPAERDRRHGRTGPRGPGPREEIARLLNERFDPDEPLETADELTMFAREYLGERIKDADVGITGANFIAADTGTMALVTSEGNTRKSVPDTCVAVAGVEKIVPSV